MEYYKSNSQKPRLETFDGTEYLVVPVVMAKAGVEMNGAIINQDQLHPESWNGVPVTIGHPKDHSGVDISANSPDTLEKYQVGTIFNAKVEDGKLKAEAWVKVHKVDEATLSRLKNMETMDVSTGYFSQIENGEYKDIKPDHLALLPNEQGACSFDDGCGVRANLFQRIMTNVKQAFDTNRRSNDDDWRQMKADLISDDRTPFTAEDEESLHYMSQETMKILRDHYLKDEPKTNKKGKTMIDKLIANADSPFSENDKEALEAMSEEAINSLSEKYLNQPEPEKPGAVLSNEDKEALELARQARQEKREEYITHITANSSMCKDRLEKMDTNTLKDIAAGIKPQADYSARGFAMATNDADMVPFDQMTEEFFANENKKVN